jgi:hypothetical protein
LAQTRESHAEAVYTDADESKKGKGDSPWGQFNAPQGPGSQSIHLLTMSRVNASNTLIHLEEGEVAKLLRGTAKSPIQAREDVQISPPHDVDGTSNRKSLSSPSDRLVGSSTKRRGGRYNSVNSKHRLPAKLESPLDNVNMTGPGSSLYSGTGGYQNHEDSNTQYPMIYRG